MSTMRVHGSTVRVDGQPVAYLTFAGRLVTVRRHQDGGAEGRLIRVSTDAAADRYDAWTAAHEATATPSDRLLAEDLSLEEGIGAVLDAVRAAS